MNIVSLSLRNAFRRVMTAFQSTRGPVANAMRPVPEIVVEKYHRAIWALDTLGPVASGDRWALREIWQNASHVAATASGVDGAAIAADIIKLLSEQCDRVLKQCEKDPNRAEWEKQRDFLLGSLRRVRRACVLNDVEHLHFYNARAEVFNVETHHPTFQIGYGLWQGIREELKAAISFTIFRDRPLHLRVEALLIQVRAIVRALEHADVSGMDFYDPRKSPLRLSPEQEGRILWEGVREQIAKIIQQNERAA